MEHTINVVAAYLGLPVWAGQNKELLEIFCGDEKLYEFVMPAGGKDGKQNCDYHAWLNAGELRGKKLVLKGNMGKNFFDNLLLSDEICRKPLERPLIHFTAERGWINDPNGLVFQDGVYHLYFQYNPMDIHWENMSWGHAVSRDLLHFRQLDTVLYPDENGTIYSGCGLVNEQGLLGLPREALLFYYTAAGGCNAWSGEKQFTQRIAVSMDAGKTLCKLPQEAVGVIEKESRDPQVFWHEASRGYVMVLWLHGETIGFLRSSDLQNWEMVSNITLPGAFECPNLFCLDRNGQEQWVLMTADGYYYQGRFDGFRFEPESVRQEAYLNGLPYAAQVYNGTKDRVILLPWLRTKNEGRLYTGMMGLPRQLQLLRQGDKTTLQLLPVREYENTKEEIASLEIHGEEIHMDIPEEAVIELAFELDQVPDMRIDIFNQKFRIEENTILYEQERTRLPEAFQEFHLLIDRQVVEIYGNDGTLNAWYETDADELTGTLTVRGCHGNMKVFKWKPHGGEEYEEG